MEFDKLQRLLNGMNLEDLRRVNRMVVNTIKGIHQERATRALQRFRVGDLVEFVDDRRNVKVRACVGRINSKTLSLQEMDALKRNWRVSPTLCRLVGG